MEEMIKIIYRNFLENEPDCMSDKIVKHCDIIEDAISSIEGILNDKIYRELDDKIYTGISEIKEQAFISGFAYCAKMMSAGKVNLFDSVLEK